MKHIFRQRSIPFNTSFPQWFLDGLQEIAGKKGIDRNDVIMECVTKAYPHIKPNDTQVFDRILGHQKTEPAV